MSETFQASRFRTVQTVKVSTANDTLIAEDLYDSARPRYTVLAVKDHAILHDFLEIYDRADYIEENTVVSMFSDQGRFFVVYPYVPERPLTEFYMGSAMALHESEDVCVNLIISCMTSNLPWPVLYLVLKQREIHLSIDRSVRLSYRIDLSELDETVGESECVNECARILIDLLEPHSGRKANSYLLLTKKSSKGSYETFKDLYRDVEIAADPNQKYGLIARFKAWVTRNKDQIFRVLLWVSVILGVFVLITFLTNLLFGDVPWLRLFIRSFERIGLESLLQ